MGKKFLLFGLPQIVGNFGCEAIVHGTGAILKHTFPDCEAVYISDGHAKIDRDRLGPSTIVNVDDSAPRFGPRFLARRIMKRVFKKRIFRRPLPARLLRKADCVLSIGGDLYTFADKETTRLWPYPYPIVKDGNAIMDKGVPYVIWCASVGPLENAGENLGILVEHLKRCKAIIVREQTSYDYLTSKLAIKENVYLAADPSYFMDPEPFEESFFTESSDPIIAINMAVGSMIQVYGAGNDNIHRLRDLYLEGISNLLSKLGLRVALVPHQIDDYDFFIDFYSRLCNRYGDRIWLAPKALGAKKTKWAVSKCAGLVSMRFHCALAGFGTCTPTVLVLTKPKGFKLIEDIYGNMDYGLKLTEFSPEALRNKVELLLNNRENIQSTLRASIEKMKSRALYAGQILKEIL
ncbi:MAG: hypothetical protein DRP65_01995 [Planctomycetota bacterium]|nr:MAG: hypothetical protein DRP65_01995 [Planctomycetota bacterium]